MKAICIILSFIVLGALNSYSCSCVEREIADAIKESKAIFKGTVISIDEIDTYSTLSDSSKRYLDSLGRRKIEDYLNKEKMAAYKIIVTAVWKGNLIAGDTVIVFSHPNEATCGFIFQSDKDYVIYGNKTGLTPLPPWIDKDLNYSRMTAYKKSYWTNFCTRTTNEVQIEINQLELSGLKIK